MQLFAIIAKVDDNGAGRKKVVEDFLKQQFSSEQVEKYLSVYDDFLKATDTGREGEKRQKRTAVSSVRVVVICNQINEELTQKQKMVVLLRLMEFVLLKENIPDQEMAFLDTVASSFNIPESDFTECTGFLKREKQPAHSLSLNHLVISGGANPGTCRHLRSEMLQEEIRVLHLPASDLFLIRSDGRSNLYLNGQIMQSARVYILSPGSSVRGAKMHPIYYSDILGCYVSGKSGNGINYSVHNLGFRFKNGKEGLHDLSFSENSGRLIGIMGGSGAGKSTLLNILNGNTAPGNGSIMINGYDLHGEKKMLEGLVGFIPQDDLLIEDLTVYQNLYYNARLCFDGDSEDVLSKKVNALLADTGLAEAAHLKVGSPMDKTISGGQRKRLNIALELIREPSVLFVDEPTSGLSSRDSENIMDMLKELALKDNLVFVVIHQPSSDIYKMFDKLLILDTGGYPVYYGDPVEALVYFRKKMNYVNAEEGECTLCGHVNPEQVFNIIESRVLDENGNQTHERKVSPAEWNRYYMENMLPASADREGSVRRPVSVSYVKPGFFSQFRIFITRDLLSKFANTQYLAINALESPLLAFVLAFLVRYFRNGQPYSYADNKNIPAYMFMCVVVSLFTGLIVSAEEIFRDRKILKRESFLDLSRGSYLLSKVFLLFVISALQTFLFVVIGNSILGIRGMYLDYWIVLFSASCFANMLGLNISASFNSAVTIYILIPFLIIPQLLLSGVLVRFDDLNPRISGKAVVPWTGELMASRWAFEALAVNQFVNNKYEKNTFAFDKDISNSNFTRVHWCTKMNSLTDELAATSTDNTRKQEIIVILKNEIAYMAAKFPGVKFTGEAGNLQAGKIHAFVSEIKKQCSLVYDAAVKKKDEYILSFQSGGEGIKKYHELLAACHNRHLEDLMKNISPDEEFIYEDHGRLRTSIDPVFRKGPEDGFLRAHFFAPEKNISGRYYSTFLVNISVLWFMSALLGTMLYFDVLGKLIRLLSAGKR